MNLREHDEREDMKVWLSAAEVDQLLAQVDGETNRRFAFALAARCGLRSEEVSDVTPNDVRESEAGPMVIVRDGKGGKYRETPIPPDLKREIDAAAEYRPQPDDWPVVTSKSDSRGASTRTLRRWMQDVREDLAESDDDRWRHLSMHDLRRTWATHLKSKDVDAMLVCDWGGWDDLETFLEAYRGDFTPEAQRRERDKVDWL
jgi:integrase